MLQVDTLQDRIRELEQRLEESEETLRALRSGEVDAVVTSGPDGDHIYTLKGADETYRLIVEQMAEGAVTLAADGLILFSNDQFAVLVGSSLNQVTGSQIQTYMSSGDKDVFGTLLKRSRGGAVKAHIGFRSVTGESVPAHVSVNRMRLEGLDCYCAVITDLREQERTQKLLDEGRISASIFEQAGEALLVVDPDGTIVRASHVADRLAGNAVLHRLFDDVMGLRAAGEPGSPPYNFKTIWSAAVRGEAIAGVEVTVVAADGERRDCLLTARRQLSETRELLGCIISLTDITVRKRAEIELRRSERRERSKASELEAILEVVPSATFIARDRECHSIVGSRFAYDLLRVPYGHNLSHSASPGEAPTGFRVMNDGQEIPIEQLPLQHSAATGEHVRDREVELLFDDGNRKILLGNAAPLFDADGQLCGSVGAFLEVTQLKRIEEELRRSNQDLEHFAYAASHDLQEPLRMLSTFSELLVRKYGGSSDADEHVAYIQDAVRRMKALIEDLLEYSQVTHGDVRADQAVCFENVLNEALMNLQTAIEESGGKVTWDPLPSTTADAHMMVRLFQNLIGNAIKYRSSRRLEIHVSAQRHGDRWVFRVQDNGIGIDMHHAETIFGIFKRLHTHQEYAGTGIGLAVARRVVERHGGRIWVNSTPGCGCVFSFTIPDKT